MTGLPVGWSTVSLSEVAQPAGGGTPSKAEPGFWIGGDIPWVSPKDMKSPTITDSEDHVTEAALDRLNLVPEGSVLVVVRSGILARTVPVALNTVPVTINQDLRAFIPGPAILGAFMRWQLIACEREILDTCSKDGTTVASLEGPALSSFQLRLAPFREQERIVGKIEELLSGLDDGVEELRSAQAKLQNYRQSILKAAVEGELTADWRAINDPAETGAQLLDRILGERRIWWRADREAKARASRKPLTRGWEAKYEEPVAADTAGLPALPVSWAWATIGQLTRDSSYGTSVKCDANFSGVPVLRIPNVSREQVDLRNLKFSGVDLGLHESDFLEPGDVLVIRTNGSIGLVGRAAAIAAQLPGPYYFASYLLRLRMVERTRTHLWLSACLASPWGRRWLEGRAASSAGQHNISLSTLLTMPIPLPPVEEQDQVLSELESAIGTADRLYEASELPMKQCIAQRQNILRAAFSGQLVPQDPADEPADALLARIRASRSVTKPPARR
ncbi:MAG TPA: restriction endonuclease subunit S, partial [Accumulibacter sp.]|nr:restriction endonuclease subunit S [Accumulibacter sp.]